MQTETASWRRRWQLLLCLLSRSGELVGFRRADYKLIRLAGKPPGKENRENVKNPVPASASSGGEEIQLKMGNRGW